MLGLDTAREVIGTQTNEAPVKAMLLAHPDVRSIICIVTSQAKKFTLGFFKTRILEFAQEQGLNVTEDTFRIINYADGEVFTEGPLQRILQRSSRAAWARTAQVMRSCWRPPAVGAIP